MNANNLPTPYPNVVRFQPGGVAGPAVFTDFTSLYAAQALFKTPPRVLVDDSLGAAHVPAAAGAYNWDGWQLVNGSGAATLIIDDGAHATWENLFIDALTVTYVGATTFFAATGEANVYVQNGSTLQTTGAGAFLVATGASAFVFVDSYPNNQLGDGTHLVLSASGGGTLETFITGGIASAAMQNAGTLSYDSSASVDSSVLPGVTLFAVSNAVRVQYQPSTPANWGTVPTTAGGALDELASALANHGQQTSAVAGPGNPLDSTALNFTPRVSGVVRVFATTVCSSTGADDGIQASLLLDGALVAGGPTPKATATNVGDFVELIIEWDVTTTLAAHTFQIRAQSLGAHNLNGSQQVVKLQELLK